MSSSLWPYAIHSNNAEVVYYLEENQVNQLSLKDLWLESVKCHHNDISNYIYDKFQNKVLVPYDSICDKIILSCNYSVMNTDIMQN